VLCVSDLHGGGHGADCRGDIEGDRALPEIEKEISREKAQKRKKENKKGTKGTTMNNDTDEMRLCDRIRETAFAIHKYHKHGHLEKVYENALAHRLRKLGLEVKQQFPLNVYDEDGMVIGEYLADLIVENRLIIELKAARAIAEEHVAQTLGYLRSARIEHGLLMNFGAARFEIRKYALSRGDSGQSLGEKLAGLSVFISALFALFRG
jgi:GxxExxY protein